jgi:hypothetical protein
VVCRKRVAAKPSSRPDAERVKLTLYLDADLARRFAVHATMTVLDRSELFAEMVRTHCRRFVVSDRQAAAGEPAEPDAA